jgi:flagellar biosynthesis protein FlhG
MSSQDRPSPKHQNQASTSRGSSQKRNQDSGQMNPQLLVFGGNKGGVGRSVISTLISLSLAEQGHRTLLIDLNLGSANLHTLLGLMQITHNFERWILDPKKSFESICRPTSHPRLSLISSAGSIINIGDLSSNRLKQLVRDALNMEIDYIVIDIGSSLHTHHLDLLNMASHSFCITTPDPLSIQNTYTLYKAVLMRRMETSLKGRLWLKKILKRVAITQDGERSTPVGEMLGMLRELDLDLHREVKSQLNSLRLSLMINQASPDDEHQVVGTLSKICQKSLSLSLNHTLTLPDEQKIRSLVRKLKSLSELDKSISIKAEVDQWVEGWLLNQSYAALQENALDMLGSPSLLGHQTPTTSQVQKPGIGQPSFNPELITEQTLLGAPQLFVSSITPTSTQMSNGSEPQQSMPRANQDPSTINSYPEAKDILEMRHLVSAQPQHSSQSDLHLQEDSFFVSPESVSSHVTHQDGYADAASHDYQSEAFIEPQPIGAILMEDPPPHEVTAIEEEVKTPGGWCHLKTSDLAPFRPSIQTSIYQDGHRDVFFEESYDGIYQSNTGTEIEKRVERIHHESAQLLQEGGIEAWCKSHNYPISTERGSDYFPLVSHEHEGYFDPK